MILTGFRIFFSVVMVYIFISYFLKWRYLAQDFNIGILTDEEVKMAHRHINVRMMIYTGVYIVLMLALR